MSANLEAFKRENATSPVVAGNVIGSGGQGAHYTLQNGKTFTLSAAECRKVLVRWLGEAMP